MSIDAAIISQAVSTHRHGDTISDLQARVIANAWHGGQSSALYSLTSTGAITDATLAELYEELRFIDARGPVDGGEADYELTALLDYAKTYGPRGPVDGWSELRW